MTRSTIYIRRRKKSESPADTVPAPPAVTRLVGSDVYEGDSMDWKAIKGQLFFLIMRAHYGTTIDTQFAKYWPAAKGAGMRTGAYGFILPVSR